QYVDVARFLLPAASVANVGVTINARSLEHALCKMFSHSLEEVRVMGEDIKAIAIDNVPTLVKYAKAFPYLLNVASDFKEAANAVLSQRNPREWCTLVDYDRDGEHKVLAAVLYRYSEISYLEALQYVDGLRIYEKLQLAENLLQDCEKHTTPLRELEHASFSFDLVLDQGAYYELKRHRMMTQSPQELTTLLGYATPRWMTDSGFGDRYHAAMQAADKAFRTLAEFNPAVASYVVPNGFNRRVLITLNLRTADHLLPFVLLQTLIFQSAG
ncbi:FAD-dependent thymidylate synthase, partial [bacterium]|nr:FAD-dependent thymidylate synthase [bacterium]